MTTKQQQAIERIKAKVREHDFKLHNDPEIKTFEVTEGETYRGWSLVFVTVEVGNKGDEGTMAALLARERRQIMIGKNGGMTLINGKKKVHGNRVFWALTK